MIVKIKRKYNVQDNSENLPIRRHYDWFDSVSENEQYGNFINF